MLDSRNLKSPKCMKYVIFSFILVCLIILLVNTEVSKHVWANGFTSQISSNDDSSTIKVRLSDRRTSSVKEMSDFRTEPIQTSISTDDVSTFRSLEDNVTSCFIKTALDIMDLSTDSSSTTFGLHPKTIQFATENKTYLYMNFAFNKLLASVGVKAAVLEPSIVHCLLQPEYKELLKKRNVSVANFSKSRTTYGIRGDDASKLQNEDNIRKFRNSGYQPHFVQAPLANWMLRNKTNADTEMFTSHVFYMYYEWTIHIVVLHNRSSYLWHSAYNPDDFVNLPLKKDLLFVDYDSAYEKFSLVPLESKNPNLANIYLPSDPHHFLFQIHSSRFLECNLSRAVNVSSSSNTPTAHTSLSVEKFNSWALASLYELKKIFNPLLMNFWIFSGTMLGWYRQCDVIPYTSDVDFAAWASEIDDLDHIIKYFLDNKKLTIVERMGILEEALEFQLKYKKLRVDVFFMYKINNGSWASGHRPSKGYYFRYHYPHFALCSAELLGERVNVPCETEDVIITEYGQNWMVPVSSWYYESSIKNRGPNIYWDEKRREKAFQEY